MSAGKATLTLMNPVLAVDDIEASVAYYQDKLGFDKTWSWGEPIVRAGVARNGYELQLDGSGTGPTGQSVVYFHMDNLDEYYESCVGSGAIIESELTEQIFGVRDFRVVDLSGNKLGFGEAIGG